MLPDFAKQPLQELDFSLGSEMCSDSFSCIVGVLKMSLRELLTTQPTGVFPDALPNPNPFDDDDIDLDFTLETTIDELFPDLFVGTLGADSIFGNNGGPDKTTNVGLDIEILPDPPDFPVTIPDTPNDILIGFGDNDFLSGGGGDDILLGDALAPNDAGSDGNDTLNGDGGNDLFIGGGANDSLNGGDGNDVLFGDYFLGFDIANININLNDYLSDDIRCVQSQPYPILYRFRNEGTIHLWESVRIAWDPATTPSMAMKARFSHGSGMRHLNGGDGTTTYCSLVPQGFLCFAEVS
jgi:Ca2+-binding RTX toxin-like protein